MANQSLRVLLLGATGTIGRATAAALIAAGHEVVAVVRPRGAAVRRRAGSREMAATAARRLACDGCGCARRQGLASTQPGCVHA